MSHDTEHPPPRQGTPMTAGQLCCCCDRPIARGQAVRVEQFSASGARPDNWRHRTCSRRR
ncbi:hypothetical protein ABZ208_13610 [Streptomyces sp. NPDC006208]|uniref:hypothetical protein n=1 Tax=Streptomyces sp. NPDC006208 TaxID=3156734 RepID=UPI0033A10753